MDGGGIGYQNLLTRLHLHAGCTRRLRRGVGIFGHVLDRGGHLFNGGGDLLNLILLLLDTLPGITGDHRKLFRGGRQFVGGTSNLAHDALQFGDKGVERGAQLTQFILRTLIQPGGEVSGSR